MIQITCKGNSASCTRTERLTSGMVGLQCEFIFDEAWDGLAKTAVFLAGNEQRDVLLTGAICTVPWEVLQHPGYQLVIGVYGSNADGTLVIPTCYAMCGSIAPGADPSGEESTDPTLPVWGQLQGMIGNLSKLETTSKDNLVDAINEAAQSGGGSGGSGVQPDWNQNDVSAPDYVKNRPFYTGDPVETVLLEETTATFAKKGANYRTEISVDFSLEIGTTYEVSWDGTVYSCVGYDFEGVAAIGNQYIFTSTSDTGEPFIAGVNSNNGTLIILTQDTSASHTISITRNLAQVTKIDEKYLPERPYMDKLNPTGTGSFSLNRKANTIVGNYSFAEGSNTKASGNYSHAEGIETTASGAYSHAEGEWTTASGMASHAEGEGTKASGNQSHAEGRQTTASGNYSHAEGNYTTASGNYSHAEGNCTTASGNYSHAEGKYNIDDTANKYAHIVGNGTSDTSRSNAHTLDWFGNAWYAGTVEGKALILPSSTEGSTKKFKITVDDSGTITATEVS